MYDSIHPHHITFVGTPNCGKTTLFNALTGLHQKVGNFPGITVEPVIGKIQIQHSTVHLIDLPGIYSFLPKSVDEQLSVDIIHNKISDLPKTEYIVAVLDGSSLEKSLFLFSFIAELGLPTIAVLTMVDEIKARNGILDDITLETILGVPVIPVVGKKGIGLQDLRDSLHQTDKFLVPNTIVQASGNIEQRHTAVREIISQVLTIREDKITEKLDSFILHPIGGPVIFLIVLGLFFQSIFTWAEPLMSGIESLFSYTQDYLRSTLPDSLLRDFITDGVIAGVGSVIVFLPQIILLNIIIVFLEDCGYLSRAAFLIDRIMGIFGLQGRSFIPLLGSYACAIPGIMSARIIPSEKDRMATIMIAPLMTCSARLPVYTLLIAACIPSIIVGGIFSLQAIVLAGLYFLAAISGLCIALVFKKTLFRGATLPFLLEFPPYRVPSLPSLLIIVWNRSKEFIKNAGSIILLFSIILWALTEFPKAEIPTGMTSLQAERIQLEQSYAGTIGKTLQPIFQPLGFDWKLTIGVIGSFAAREVFVSVMGQLYSADVSDSDAQLRTILQQTIPFATAISVMLFYVYALQCISTIAIIKKETGSWKWSMIAFAYTFMLAYSTALIGYNLVKLI